MTRCSTLLCTLAIGWGAFGCAANCERAMDAWVGRSVGEAVQRIGKPKRIDEQEAEGQVYTWSRSRYPYALPKREKTPPTTQCSYDEPRGNRTCSSAHTLDRLYPVGDRRGYPNESAPPTKVDEFLEFEFVVDQGSIIRSWSGRCDATLPAPHNRLRPDSWWWSQQSPAED